MATLDNIYRQETQSVREQVLQYIKNSERSGCTYDKDEFANYVNTVTRKSVDSQKGLTSDEKKMLRTSIFNSVYAETSKVYDDSMANNPRATNNKDVPKVNVSDERAATNSQALAEAKTRLKNSMDDVLKRSVETGITPSEQQFINKFTADATTMANGILDDSTRVYVQSYLDAWVVEEAAKKYNQSLIDNYRTVNNEFPPDEKAEAEAKKKEKEKNKNYPARYNQPISVYADKYNTFSGTDMVCTVDMELANGKMATQVIGELQTITYSTHNEKMPIRCLGDMNAKGYVFGPRTIAGTLVFSVFDRHWATNLMKEYSNSRGVYPHYLADELPPFNVTFSCANEYGKRARMALYGITLVNEGQTMSCNDVYIENTYQFYALDIEYIQPVNIPKEQEPEEEDFTKLDTGTKNVKYLNDVSGKNKSDTKKELSQPEDPDHPRMPKQEDYDALEYEDYKNAVLKSAQETDKELKKKYDNLEISQEEYDRLTKKNQETFEQRIEKAKEYYSSSGYRYRSDSNPNSMDPITGSNTESSSPTEDTTEGKPVGMPEQTTPTHPSSSSDNKGTESSTEGAPNGSGNSGTTYVNLTSEELSKLQQIKAEAKKNGGYTAEQKAWLKEKGFKV